MGRGSRYGIGMGDMQADRGKHEGGQIWVTSDLLAKGLQPRYAARNAVLKPVSKSNIRTRSMLPVLNHDRPAAARNTVRTFRTHTRSRYPECGGEQNRVYGLTNRLGVPCPGTERYAGMASACFSSSVFTTDSEFETHPNNV